MAGKNSIQILRGTETALAAHQNQVFLDGQPLYDKTNNWLCIGSGGTIGARKPISIDFSQDALTTNEVEEIWGSSTGNSSGNGSLSSSLITNLTAGKVPVFNGLTFDNANILTGNSFIGFVDNAPDVGGRHIRLYKDKVVMLRWDNETEDVLYNFSDFNERLNSHNSRLLNHDTNITELYQELTNFTGGLSTQKEGFLPKWNGSAFFDSRAYLGTNFLGYQLGNTGYAFAADGIYEFNPTTGAISSARHDFKSIKSDISALYQLNTQQNNTLQTQSNSISSLKTTTETLSATTTNLNTLLATCIQHIYFNNGTGHLDDTVSQYTIDKPGIYIFTIVSGSSLISIYKDRYYTSSNTLVRSETAADEDIAGCKTIIMIVPENNTSFAGQRAMVVYQNDNIVALSSISSEPMVFDRRCKHYVKSINSTDAKIRVWALPTGTSFSKYWV